MAELIGGKAPTGYAPARIAEDLGELSGPGGPTFHVLGIIVVRAAFGPVHLDIRKSILYAAHPFRLARVSMPGHGSCVFANVRSFQFSDGTTPQIIVVVDNPNFRAHTISRKLRTKMQADKIRFVALRPEAGWHQALLVGIHFILYGHGLNRHLLRFVSAQKFHKVFGIGRHVRAVHAPPEQAAVVFHPSWGAPRRREQE